MIGYARVRSRPERHARRATVAAAIAWAAALAGCGFVHRSGQSMAAHWNGLVHRGRQTIAAHYESPPDWALAVPPCTVKTIPRSGMCRGVGHSTTPTTVSGDWSGRSEYSYGWLTLPSGTSHTLNLATFTGTVKGCGTGTMTYRTFGACDPRGQCKLEWHTIDGLGTGDLTHLKGRGTLTGVLRDDFSSIGDFQGWVHCGR